jgi:hypothetical protein
VIPERIRQMTNEHPTTADSIGPNQAWLQSRMCCGFAAASGAGSLPVIATARRVTLVV